MMDNLRVSSRRRAHSRMKSTGDVSFTKPVSRHLTTEKTIASHRRVSSVTAVMGLKNKKSVHGRSSSRDQEQRSNSPSPFNQSKTLSTPWFLDSVKLKDALLHDLEKVVKHQLGCPVGGQEDLADLDRELTTYIYSAVSAPKFLARRQPDLKKWEGHNQKLQVTDIHGRYIWCGNDRHYGLPCTCQVKMTVALKSSTDGETSYCAFTGPAFTKRPKWNDNLEVIVGKVQEMSLLVQLRDVQNQIVGGALVPLQEILLSKWDSWVDMKRSSRLTSSTLGSDSCGEVHLHVQYLLQKPLNTESSQCTRSFFELAAQTFFYYDFRTAIDSSEKMRRRTSSQSRCRWDGELSDLAMYLLLQIQNQHNLSDFTTHALCMSAAVKILTEAVNRRTQEALSGKMKSRPGSKASCRTTDSSSISSKSNICSILKCIEKVAQKLDVTPDCNAEHHTEDVSIISKSVKTCSDIALDIISSSSDVFPPLKRAALKQPRLIENLLGLLSKLYTLPCEKSHNGHLEGDVASSIVARVKDWHGQQTLPPLSSVGWSPQNTSELQSALQDISHFIRKCEAILGSSMRDKDAMFSVVEISYSKVVSRSLLKLVTPDLTEAEMIVHFAANKDENTFNLLSDRGCIKELQNLAMASAGFCLCARNVLTAGETSSETFNRLYNIVRRMVTALLPHFFGIWERETMQFTNKAWKAETIWCKAQTLESMCGINHDELGLESGEALRTHLKSVWTEFTTVLEGIIARDIIRFDQMLISTVLKSLDFYLTLLRQRHSINISVLSEINNINPAPVVYLNNWDTVQTIVRDLGRSLTDQFHHIFLVTNVQDGGVAHKSLYAFAGKQLDALHDVLRQKLAVYKSEGQHEIGQVAEQLIDPFIQKLLANQVTDHGYEILHSTLPRLKSLFERFEMILSPDSSSRLVAEMFIQLVDAAKKHIMLRPYIKPGFYRRVLWQLSKKENKESSIEQVFSMHTKEPLDELPAYKSLLRFLVTGGVSTGELIKTFWEKEAAATALPEHVTTVLPVKIHKTSHQGDFVTLDVYCDIPGTVQPKEAMTGSVLNRLMDFTPLPADNVEVVLEQVYVPFLFLASSDKAPMCEAQLPKWQPGANGRPSVLSLCFTLQGVASQGACVLFRLYERRKSRLSFDSEDYYGRALLPLAQFANKECLYQDVNFNLVFSLQEISRGEEIYCALRHRAHVVKGPGEKFFDTEEKFQKRGLQMQQKLGRTSH